MTTFTYDFGRMIEVEEKSLSENSDAWVGDGYGAIWDNLDLVKDVARKGMFARSLRDNGLPLLLVQHKMDELPVGTITAAEEDSKGLRIEFELPKDDPTARRVAGLLKARKGGARGLKGLSIGYITRKSQRIKHSGQDARELLDADLIEVSFVNRAANPLAQAGNIKSEFLTVEEFKSLSDREREAHLRSLGLSDSWSKYLTKCTREAGVASKAQREAGEVSDYAKALPSLADLIRNTAQRI